MPLEARPTVSRLLLLALDLMVVASSSGRKAMGKSAREAIKSRSASRCKVIWMLIGRRQEMSQGSRAGVQQGTFPKPSIFSA